MAIMKDLSPKSTFNPTEQDAGAKVPSLEQQADVVDPSIGAELQEEDDAHSISPLSQHKKMSLLLWVLGLVLTVSLILSAASNDTTRSDRLVEDSFQSTYMTRYPRRTSVKKQSLEKYDNYVDGSIPNKMSSKSNFHSDIHINVTITGPPISIWSMVDSWKNCGILDVPDIPTRAFFVNSSQSPSKVHMMQGSTNFHYMTGPTLFQQERACYATWNKTANNLPQNYAANEFLDSTWAFPNGTVIALTHTEYPGDRYDNCPPGGHPYPLCWTVSLGLMVSHDNGVSWQHARPPPHHLVAAVPYAYNYSQLASGWGDPTNIVYNAADGYYYVAVWNRHDVGLQKAGVCMMRTASLMEPDAWRAWNGSHFSVSLAASPYSSSKHFDPAQHICTVLDVNYGQLGSPFGLVWSDPLQRFVMTWGGLVDGPFHMTLSQDLILWSAPTPFFDRNQLPPAYQRHVTSIHYPSLMDASAPLAYGDNNYQVIGGTPHLFWVSFGHNPYTDGRVAYATPLEINKVAPDNEKGDEMAQRS